MMTIKYWSIVKLLTFSFTTETKQILTRSDSAQLKQLYLCLKLIKEHRIKNRWLKFHICVVVLRNVFNLQSSKVFFVLIGLIKEKICKWRGGAIEF